MPDEPRILVLGSAPHGLGVHAYEWDRLPANLNVADYDVAILNFLPFSENQDLREGMNRDRLPGRDQFLRLMFSRDSEIIAIGDPRVELGRPDENGPPVFAAGTVPVTWWLPVYTPVTPQGGTEIREIDREWEWYFQAVSRYDWYFEDVPAQSRIDPDRDLQIIHRRANGLSYERDSLAETRFHQPVAYEMRFAALYRFTNSDPMGDHFEDAEGLATSGRVVWLPTPTLGPRETVDLVLRERFGLAVETAPPDWVDAYRLPREAVPEAEIAQREAEIRVAKEALRTAEVRAREESRFRLLLYETGEDVLEPVVRDALRALGAEVQDPKVKGREDGRLVDPAQRNGMLEIKGRTGQLPLKDVRQLDQWVRDALVNEGWKSKGLLIANLKIEQPPWERDDVYAPNSVPAAVSTDICLMTTTQLYEALRKHQLEQLDLDAFWESVFSTQGICELPEVERQE